MKLLITKVVLLLLMLVSCSDKKRKTNNKDITNDKSNSKQISDTANLMPVEYEYDNEVFELGTGVVIAPDEFIIYGDSLLTQEFIRIDMYNDPLPIYAKYTKPDYGIMHFACLSQTEKYYVIVVDSTLIKYIPTNKSTTYLSWNEYISESLGIRRNNSQSIRNQPKEESSKVILPKGYEMLCPVGYNDNWIKVKWDCFYNNHENKYEGEYCNTYIELCNESPEGWIKWKDKNKVLIDIFYLI